MGNKTNRLTLRITPWQAQVLEEMSQAMEVSYALLIRAIIGDWLTKNEEYIYRIIEKKVKDHAKNQQTTEEEDIFGEERD